EGRPEIGGLAAERLRRLVRALGDRAAHPGARDVREVSNTLGAAPGAEGDAAEVDLADLPAARDRDGPVEAPRDPVRARKIDAGAARQHRELRRRGDESVRRPVDGPVAADGD